jgi:hypothetical protein
MKERRREIEEFARRRLPSPPASLELRLLRVLPRPGTLRAGPERRRRGRSLGRLKRSEREL